MHWFEEYAEPEGTSRYFEFKLVVFMMCSFLIYTSHLFFQYIIFRLAHPTFPWTESTESWVAVMSIFSSTFMSIITDAFAHKLHVEFAGILLGLVISTAMLIIEVLVNAHANIVFTLSILQLVLQRTFFPTCVCIFLQQLRFMSLSMKIEYLISFAIWGSFAAVTLFAIIVQLTSGFFDVVYVPIVSFSWFIFWYLFKLGFFISMYKQAFKCNVSYHMMLSMSIITYIQTKRKLPWFKDTKSKYAFSDWAYYCTYRFWYVLLIAAFFAPWGFGYLQIRTVQRKHAYNLAKIESIGTNYFSLHAYSGFLLFPVFIAILWARQKKFLASDLKQITLAEVILGLGLLFNALYESVVEAKLGSVPVEDAVQIRVISALPTPVNITSDYANFTLNPYSQNTFSRISGDKKDIFETYFHIHSVEYNIHEKVVVAGEKGKSILFVVDRSGLKRFGFEPLPTGEHYQRGVHPLVYLLTTLNNVTVMLQEIKGPQNYILKGQPSNINSIAINKGTYDIYSSVAGVNHSVYQSFPLEPDSVYAVLIHDTEKFNIRIYQLVNLRMLEAIWELPVTICITLARYIEVVYAMRFAAFQIPPYFMTVTLSFGINMESLPELLYFSRGFLKLVLSNNYILLAVHYAFVILFIYIALKNRSYDFEY